MARQSGLGRGLQALIPTEAAAEPGRPALLELPVHQISANPNQPRQVFDPAALQSLTDSIRELGVLQPVLVRRVAASSFELVAGERRWRAAMKAGLSSVPAVVRDVDDLTSVEQALVENLHREDLNPLEEAAAYQQLIEDFGCTHEQLSARVGRSRASITNALRLLNLSPATQRLLAEGELSAGHGRALLGADDRQFQEELARRIVAEQLSVRATEEAVRQFLRPQEPDSPGPGDQDPPGGDGAAPRAGHTSASARQPGATAPAGLLELEELLAGHLDTRVRVDLGSRKGRIVIDFADLSDLERIVIRMTGGDGGVDPGAGLSPSTRD